MKGYIIITWPESQMLMEQKWFNECILINDEQGFIEYGSSAYYVPKHRYIEMINSEMK